MSELKPCLKCGFIDCHAKKHSNRFGDEWWGMKCNKCGNEVVSKLYDVPMDAVWAWNRRAEDVK